MAAASGPIALKTVAALVRATVTLPGVRSDQIGLFGHSRGGGAALNYVLDRGAVSAVVLDSGVYPAEFADRASRIRIPTLMLHGTADSPADGGAASTDVRMARAFEDAMRRAGQTVEAQYYDGGQHNGIFASSTQFDDEVRRIAAFFVRHRNN